MKSEVDPYHLWLGIPPHEQPPHFYRLLGIALFESDADVIAMAAQRQMAHVKQLASGPHPELSQQILNELATARICLLDPARKADYDSELRARGDLYPTPPPVAPAPPMNPAPPMAPAPPIAPAPPMEPAPPIAPGIAMAAASPDPTAAPAPPDLSANASGPEPASERRFLIGSGDTCDVVFSLSTVSSQHCSLVPSPAGYLIEDLRSTNGTFVNGRRVTATTLLAVTDRVTLGQSVRLDWVRVVHGIRAIHVGTASDNDVVLKRPTISRYHAVLLIRGQEITVRDKRSTNGLSAGEPSCKIQTARVQRETRLYFGSQGVTVAELLAACRPDSP